MHLVNGTSKQSLDFFIPLWINYIDLMMQSVGLIIYPCEILHKQVQILVSILSELKFNPYHHNHCGVGTTYLTVYNYLIAIFPERKILVVD